MTAWARGSLWHEFLGDTRTRFSSAEGNVPLRSDPGGMWLELAIGISGQFSRTGTLYGGRGSACHPGRSRAVRGNHR